MKKVYALCFLFVIVILVAFSIFFINKKETVAVIGAMDLEIEEVVKNISDKKYEKQADFKIITGNLGKYKIILSKSGVGKVNSAITTQFIIDKYKPKFIVNTGIAGSISSDLKTGDTIIAKKMLQHDFDVTAFGYSKGYMDNDIEPDKPTLYYSDKLLVDKFIKNSGETLKNGTIATGDIFVADIGLKNSIRKYFGADAVDMESAAIAQTAQRNNIPIIILRTISDGIDGNEKEYKENKQALAKQASLIVISILKNSSNNL